MQIHGREIHFLLTVRAADSVAQLCPGQDMSKIVDVLRSGSYTVRSDAARKFVAAMAAGYDDALKYEDPDADPQNLTEDELQTIPVNQLWKLMREAISQFIADQMGTVEVAPEKKEAAPGSN